MKGRLGCALHPYNHGSSVMETKFSSRYTEIKRLNCMTVAERAEFNLIFTFYDGLGCLCNITCRDHTGGLSKTRKFKAKKDGPSVYDSRGHDILLS